MFSWRVTRAPPATPLRLRLRRVLLLTMFALATMFAFATMLARLLVALIGRLPVTLVVAPAVVAHIGLRLLLHRDETRLLTEARKILAFILAVLARDLVGTRLLLLLRLVLAELLLGSGDQAEIMFGMLVVILRRHRVAGRARVAGELQVFLGDVGGSAADLDVGPVRFEHPGHRILAAPVVVVIVVIPVTHPLVVLTVSHVLPLFQP